MKIIDRARSVHSNQCANFLADLEVDRAHRLDDGAVVAHCFTKLWKVVILLGILDVARDARRRGELLVDREDHVVRLALRRVDRVLEERRLGELRVGGGVE